MSEPRKPMKQTLRIYRGKKTRDPKHVPARGVSCAVNFRVSPTFVDALDVLAGEMGKTRVEVLVEALNAMIGRKRTKVKPILPLTRGRPSH